MKILLFISMMGLGLQFSYLAFGTENKKTAKFVQNQVESQIMDIEEGNLAIRYGTTPMMRDYGKWMVEDHTRMLNDLKHIVDERNLVVLYQLCPKKVDGLSNLTEKRGNEFDELFIKMMVSDHKRDVCYLKRGKASKDAEVKKFSEKYLPVVEKHLDGIRSIRKSMNEVEIP